jgi:hypothetical protein
MSDNNIAVISTPTSNFITQVIEVHEPILSAAQGPQGPQGVAGSQTLSGLTDINLDGLTDGSMLVYQAEFFRWKSTTVLDKQVLDSGQY